MRTSASPSGFAARGTSSSGGTDGLTGSSASSRTSSGGGIHAEDALAAAFGSSSDANDDEFGAFAAAAPPAPALSPPATSDYYADVFGASASSSTASASSLMASAPPLSASSVSVFSQSGLSEISFADDEYDSPFADIVNEPPKSAGASRASSFSHSGTESGFEPVQQTQPQQQTNGGSIEIGSPLLSFSPVATLSSLSTASAVPDVFSASVDVFSLSTTSVSSAPPAEAELLSFSPLALSSSAPSGSSGLLSFALDTPVPAASPASSAGSSKLAPRFSLPPPRAATMASVSPGAASAAKAASFSGQVSVGELLSFSPVASAPVSSFSDSIGSSGVGGASIFGDDELFSLSTTDMTIDLSAEASAVPSLTAVAAEPVEVLSAASSPAAATDSTPSPFDDSMIQDFTVSQSAAFEASAVPVVAADEEEDAAVAAPSLAFLDTDFQEVDVQEAESEFQALEAELLEQPESPTSSEQQSSSDDQLTATGVDETQQSLSVDGASSADDHSDERSPVAEAPQSTPDAQRLSIPSPVGYSQFEFISQGFSPQAGSEAASTPTGLPDGKGAAEYASFSSSNASDDGADAGEQDEESAAANPAAGISPTELQRESELEQAAEYGGFEFSALPESSPSATDEQSVDATDGSPKSDDFDAFGESPAIATGIVENGISGDQVSASAMADAADDDALGGFSAAPTSESTSSSFPAMALTAFLVNDSSAGDFGGFTSGSFGGAGDDTADDFGDFAQSSNPLGGDDDGDDGFGDFGQSSGGDGGDGGDDGFGDFGQSSNAVGDMDDDDDGFGGFQQSAVSGSSSFGASSDDDFGDFSAPPPAPVVAPSSFAPVTAAAASISTPSTSSKQELDSFFLQAFPVYATPTPLDITSSPQAPALPSYNSKDIFQDKHARSSELVATIYRSAVESYFQDSSSAIGSTLMGTEHFSSELKALRLKHLKYVLTEKIQEAARHDGIFPHGSEKHHVLLSLVNSDDERKMRDALTSVQDSLFNSSVNDAMMRIARQAALSAKAKIAEQAAHQQASSRGSLLATTRQLLSRSGGSGTAGAGSHDNDATAGSSSHANGSGSGGDDSGGEAESGGRNSYDADAGRNSSSGGSGGGLMKKFQDRFSSFSSSRSRTRLVSLRRMGQSGEDVRKMELNMDSISGGLDEVKWKCAVFLYDVDEVAQVAPSQISILSYPGKEVLAAKSDRTALMKFFKAGAIWTIDIGASNNDVLNEW